MRVWLHPNPKPVERLNSGLDVAVYYMHRTLPAVGVELTSDRDDAHLRAVHICSPNGDPVDVVHCHGLYPTASLSMGSWAWEVNARVIDAVRSAYAVTVPSRWVGEIFARDLGFWPHVVPHGIDMREWPAPGPREVRAIVLWNKNRDTDVCNPKPVNRLAEACPDFRFVTTFGEEARNVTVIGLQPIQRMREVIYRCGIYYSSTKETFGIGTLEAMAAGLPVLGWKWGATPDIVRHDVEGYLVDPYDLDAEREGLHYILDNYERLSKAARERALSYTWKNAARAYRTVYNAALAAKREESQAQVSVIIPCYNYEQYVGRAIESVKEQKGVDWELIVVNDGSTDGSLEVIREAIGDDPRCRVIDKANTGVADTRNAGAMASEAPFICFLDADDFLMPGALRRLLKPMLADRRLGLAYGKLYLTDAEAKTTSVGAWPGAFDASKQVNRQNCVPSFNMMRREAFLRTGGFRQLLAPAEDAELWTRLTLAGYDIAQVTEEPVYVYRMHDKSATSKVRGAGKEPDWSFWLPGANGGSQPIASRVPPKHISHPVYPYDEPMVSVVIPVGPRHVEHVRKAIESVAAQTDPRWELIVVDDTQEIVPLRQQGGAIPYEQVYPWVRWLENPHPGNVSAARNVGAEIARGRFLCFLDADDYLLRDYFKATLEITENCETDSVIVYTDWISSPEGKEHQAKNWNLSRLLEYALFAVTNVHPKAAWKTVGGFDETLPLWEDWDYMIRLGLEGYKGVRVPKPLFVYCYDTGLRREASLEREDELLERIKARYASAVPKPRRSCSRCASGASNGILQVKRPTVLQTQPNDVKDRGVLLEMSSGISGHRVLRVPGGGRYHFGEGKDSRQYVKSKDVDFFLRRWPGIFRVVPVEER